MLRFKMEPPRASREVILYTSEVDTDEIQTWCQRQGVALKFDKFTQVRGSEEGEKTGTIVPSWLYQQFLRSTGRDYQWGGISPTFVVVQDLF